MPPVRQGRVIRAVSKVSKGKSDLPFKDRREVECRFGCTRPACCLVGLEGELRERASSEYVCQSEPEGACMGGWSSPPFTPSRSD